MNNKEIQLSNKLRGVSERAEVITEGLLEIAVRKGVLKTDAANSTQVQEKVIFDSVAIPCILLTQIENSLTVLRSSLTHLVSTA